MGQKFKLKRPIKDASGEKDIDTVEMKDEKDISASDFYSFEIRTDGKTELGGMADPISNLFGLTDEQVASLDIKDFVALSAEVGKFIE